MEFTVRERQWFAEVEVPCTVDAKGVALHRRREHLIAAEGIVGSTVRGSRVEVTALEVAPGGRGRVETLYHFDVKDRADDFHSAVQALVPQLHDHVHIVVNPYSGTKTSPALCRQLCRLLGDTPHTVYYTEAPHHATRIAKGLDLKDGDVVCCIGGDGTMHEVLNGLPLELPGGGRPTVATIPTGTGNGLAATLGMHGAVEGMWALLRGRRSAMDLFQVTQPRPMHRVLAGVDEKGPVSTRGFLHLSYGIISDIDFDSEVIRFVGSMRFHLMAVWKVLQWPDYRARLRMKVRKGVPMTVWVPGLPAPHRGEEGDWVEIEGTFLFIVAANAAEISSGLVTNPTAHLADGLIDVAVVRKPPSRAAGIEYFLKADGGQMLGIPTLELYKAEAVEIFPLAPSPDKGKLDLDGEWAPYGDIKIAPMPSAVSVMTPLPYPA